MSEQSERTEGPVGLARHGRLRRRSGWSTLLKFVAGAITTVLVSTLAVAGYELWSINNAVAGNTVDLGDGGKYDIPSLGAIPGPVTMLLVGNDSREGYEVDEGHDGGGTLNDVNMVLHVSADHTRASIISLPRDMIVPIPACPREDGKGTHSAMSAQPLNNALSYGGLPCVVLTVEKLLGIDIPYAGMIGFQGVIEMSNAIGGVEVCIAEDITSREAPIKLTAGTHTLQGRDALLFLRMRKGIGDGSDLSRIGAQQAFMSSLMRTVLSAETLSDPATVYKLARVTAENLTLSSNLASVTSLASMALTVKDLDVNNITFLKYPVVTYVPNPNKVAPDKTSAATMLDAVFNDREVVISAKAPSSIVIDEPETPAVDDGADASTTDPEPTTAPEPTQQADETPAPTTTADGPVALPSNVTGQSAGQVSCVR